MDKENVLNKIQEELECPLDRANWIYEQLIAVAPELLPSVEGWYSGKCNNYEEQGISLNFIMEKDHCSYLQAVLRMNLLLRNQQMLSFYLENEYLFE